MPHIHKLIDFVVCIYIVYKNKILLVHHRKLNEWLPVGGHIELDEDPEEALFREVKEETRLEIEVLGEKPQIKVKETKFLYPPIFLDIHDISETHKHIGLIYFARAKSDNVTLAKKEHRETYWFTKEELDDPKFKLLSGNKFYAKEALKKI